MSGSTTFTYNKLTVEILNNADALGRKAADDFAAILSACIAKEGKASVILATGNSQIQFIENLKKRTDLVWKKVSVFHLDEYIGITKEHPASFRRYFMDRLFDVVTPKYFYGIQGDAADLEDELIRYSALLKQFQPDICVMGIGENGHLAFNDPPADFETDESIHIVSLDDVSRRQQVGEGHFASLDEVPEQAFSLTIPELLKPSHLLAIVPEVRKAEPVREALEGPISPDCPASILQNHSNARLYLDQESASLLKSFRASETNEL